MSIYPLEFQKKYNVQSKEYAKAKEEYLKTKKLLSQEEVNVLPDGTVVVVWWTGGNGPFKYIVKHYLNHEPYALLPKQYEEADLHVEFYDNNIGFVGKDRYHTFVWIPDETDDIIPLYF